MIANNTKIQSLLQLLDDPDQDIYNVIRNEFLQMGSLCIPHLQEYQLVQNDSELIQSRIAELITTIDYRPIVEQFTFWKEQTKPDLFEAALLLNKLVYGSSFEEGKIKQEFEEIQKMIWVEMNNYLTPQEKVKIISTIVFKIKKVSAQVVDYTKPEEFLVDNALLHQKGNNYSVSVIYLALCQIFGVPVKALRFPKHIILGYFDEDKDKVHIEGHNLYNIKFFIDPSFGNVLTHDNITVYFDRIGEPLEPKYFSFLTNQELVAQNILELTKCYSKTEKKQLTEIAKIILP